MNANEPRGDAWLSREFDRLLAFARKSVHPYGFASLTRQGEQDHSADVETYVTCRMTHVFALAHLLGGSGDGEFGDAGLVDHGVAALQGPLHDDEHGGWFAGIRPDGTAREAKEAYVHAFVMLAAASAAVAGRPGADDLLRSALDVVDTHFWEEDHGLHRESWDRSWTEPEAYRGVNANMHLVESLLAAGDATAEDRWVHRALRMIERVVHGFAREHGWRLPEHFTPGWEVIGDYNRDQPAHPFRPYGVTIGHLLEWSRLCLHADAALAARGSSPPAWLRHDAAALFDRAVADGWSVDGQPGLVYTVDPDGRPVVRHRMHWVVTEAIGAAAVLETVTGDERYRGWQATWWDYAEEHLIDRADGSWFHELDEENRVAGDTWAGKPDVYHAAQATILPRAPLAGSVAAMAGALAGGDTVRRDRIGVQLFTLRDRTAQDMTGTLRRLAGMRCGAVEFAGFGDSTPAAVRTVLDEVGIVAVGAHVPFDEWRDRRDGVLDDLTTLGVTYGVVPSVPAELRRDPDAVAALATLLDGWGAACRARGLRLAYHNHEKEFAVVGGRTVWDALVAATDPELVAFELDVYWAAVGGADPVALLRAQPERIPLIHAKDLAPGVPPVNAPVGAGVLPWGEIVSTPEASSRWYLVELDTSDTPLDDVERSLEFLAALAHNT